MMANLNDLFCSARSSGVRRVCRRFRISGRSTQLSITKPAGGACHVEEQNLQQDRALGFLQKEVADMREGHSREITALSAQFAQENHALREEQESSESSREQEIAALRREQDGLRNQFARKLPV
jgi:hypothetical protein